MDPIDPDLQALGADLAAAEASRWEPRCVAHAFARRPGALVFTMQGWIDLDYVQSPLLEGRLPDYDADPVEWERQMEAAVDAFDLGCMELTAEEWAETGICMLDAIADAFAMSMGMVNPAADLGGASAPSGFGQWLPILACLISQIGMSRLEALATPVGQALALIAAHRSNQGWEPMGATYAQREALQKGTKA